MIFPSAELLLRWVESLNQLKMFLFRGTHQILLQRLLPRGESVIILPEKIEKGDRIIEMRSRAIQWAFIVFITAFLANGRPLLAQNYEEAVQAAQGNAMRERLAHIIESGSPVKGYLQTDNIATNFSLTFEDFNSFSGTFHAYVSGELAMKCSASWPQNKTASMLQGQLNDSGDLNLALADAMDLTLSFPAGNPQEDKLSGTYKLFCPPVQRLTGNVLNYFAGRAFLDLTTSQ